MNQIDFLASQPHYLDHIAPIWDALPAEARGTFWVPLELRDYAYQVIQHQLYVFHYENNSPQTYGVNPVLVAAYGDMMYAYSINPTRPIVMMEHGIGHTFGTPAHPDGKGKRDYVSLFLPPNEYTKRKIQVVRPDVPCIPIGTPKMDQYVNRAEHVSNEPPIVAIGFHHGDRRKGERGSAFEHYKEILPELHKRYRLLAYSHPLSEAVHRPIYEQHGIPYTSDFSTVMNTADICINDLSSALYEFLVTWRPVVVLDAPWFRKDVHWGIRFWDYSDIGINVWQPEDLPAAIDKTLLYHETICISERRKAIIDLYPYLGIAARQAAAVLVRYLAGEIP